MSVDTNVGLLCSVGSCPSVAVALESHCTCHTADYRTIKLCQAAFRNHFSPTVWTESIIQNMVSKPVNKKAFSQWSVSSVAAASLPNSAMTEECMSYSGVVLDMSAPQAGRNLAPL